VTDATGRPDRILLLGGSSEIGRAICLALAAGRPADVIVAGRPSTARDEAVASFDDAGLQPQAVDLDVTDVDAHGPFIDWCLQGGDIDVVVLAFGALGDHEQMLEQPRDAAHLALVNHVGGVSLGLHATNALRRQGRGTVIVLSSMAALVPRPANFVYGSTKAGLDAFFVGLADAVRRSGVRVHVVRAGFVRTRMTRGLPVPPLASTPGQVADAVVAGVRRGRTVIWAPPIMQLIGTALRLAPRTIVRRLKV